MPPKHGEYKSVIRGNNQIDRCQKCTTSKGEKRIEKYLLDNNIEFKDQHRFQECKYNKTLPFDFYIPSMNLAIEYQGEQHYKSIKHFGGEENFKIQQKRDQIKREYCKENHIRLLEIPYTDYNNIECILAKESLKS